MDWVTTAASIPILILILWLYTAQIAKSFPTLRDKRICLLIAHPDDEAMFFAPAVLALTRPELGNHLKILCLSSGNADGIGEARKKELTKSARILGLRSDDDVLVLDLPDFPDSLHHPWSPPLISTLLLKTFAPTLPSSSSLPPTSTIDTLLTFDPHGVSLHPNHTSLYHGALAFLSSLTASHPGFRSPVTLYTLTTVNILRKYMSILDAPATLLWGGLFRRKEKGENPTPLLFVSGLGGWGRARRSMTRGHGSQMRWFRWGWVVVGRYMVVNDLRKVRM